MDSQVFHDGFVAVEFDGGRDSCVLRVGFLRVFPYLHVAMQTAGSNLCGRNPLRVLGAQVVTPLGR